MMIVMNLKASEADIANVGAVVLDAGLRYFTTCNGHTINVIDDGIRNTLDQQGLRKMTGVDRVNNLPVSAPTLPGIVIVGVEPTVACV